MNIAGVARGPKLIHWLRTYSGKDLTRDLLGSLIVSFMFLPQSLAYAFLAGLPPEVGIYASIIPLIGYMIFGTSRVLAVGPVAVIALMTASALAPLASAGTAHYAGLALVLSVLSGAILLLMGIFRLGFLSNLLSNSVISGFVMASAVLIALSQVKVIMGINVQGNSILEILPGLVQSASSSNVPTLIIGCSAILFLLAVRTYLRDALDYLGLPQQASAALSRTGPLLAASLFTAIAYVLNLPSLGVATVGNLPSVIPRITLPPFDYHTWRALLLPALLLSIVGFVESVSVAKTFAARRRERISPDSELLGLGTANVLAAFCGGMPVSGGFSRSVVNSDAGVRTPISSLFTGIGIAVVVLFFTPVIAHVPLAVLSATIIVAALSLIDFNVLAQTWSYSKSDFTAVAATIFVTLTEGVEVGIAVGVVISILVYLYRTSKPHVAVVGLVPQTEHFRNVKRHDVVVSPNVLSVRIDESLYFANSAFLEDTLTELLLQNPTAKHLVLICSAINAIDISALETLESLNLRLKEMGVTFHLSEVKGPVQDRLKRSNFLKQLTGKVFLSQFQAVAELDPTILKKAWQQKSATQQPGHSLVELPLP